MIELLTRAVVALEKIADATAELAHLEREERGYESERPPRLWSRDQMG